MSDVARILVATDVAADAALIRKLLHAEFGDVLVCDDGNRLAEDFDKHRPAILIVAFDSLEKAERFALGLYRHSNVVHSVPHRTVVLCSKDDLQPVYQLCKKRYFDDYVLFWPMTHDATRLPMAVHQGLWSMPLGESRAHLATQMMAEARPLLNLDSRLQQIALLGKQRIELASMRLRQDRDDFVAALEPLNKWTSSLKEELERELHAASRLRAIAAEVRPAVLVVEDDEFQQKILLELLAELGLRTIAAASGLEALSVVRQFPPDLVLMDVNLPDMNGIDVTRRLKADPLLAAIPVVMITGRSERDVVVESMKAGATDFVVKPYDRDVLLPKISGLLRLLPSRPRQRGEST